MIYINSKLGLVSSWKLLIGLLISASMAMTLLLSSHPSKPKVADEYVRLPYNLPGKYEGTKVPLHIGNTHFSVAVDYIHLTPLVGEGFQLVAAWPSMRSIDEEIDVYDAKIDGKPGFYFRNSILIVFHRLSAPDGFRDTYRSYVLESSLNKKFRTERLDDLGLYRQHRGGNILYWSIDERIATPYHNLPYAIDCSLHGTSIAENERQPQPGDTCRGAFQVNSDLSVSIQFNNPPHLKDWQAIYFKTLEFIKSIDIT